jgi:dTDP-4-dehydrorhamnose 3,5-epimerase
MTRTLQTVEIRELSVPGAYEVTPTVHGDARGSFAEWFRADDLADLLGHRFELAQANLSVSRAGSLRGIHYAEVPPSQAKYVCCMTGAALDVVVDIRVGSPTYGQWDGVLVDATHRRAVYLGEGLGHAFMALEDATTVAYLCSAPYAPGREHGVHPLDPAIGIEWPTHAPDGTALKPVLSQKDQDAPTLAEQEASGLLPEFDAALAYVASLA